MKRSWRAGIWAGSIGHFDVYPLLGEAHRTVPPGTAAAEIGDEQGHAQFLADKIAALGGEPTTQPRPVPHADQPREMLEHALAAEQQAIADYNARIGQAEAFGDFGLKVELENQVADETRHKEELERIIAGWDDR